MYYTKNTKDTHPELMENALGCYSKQTATIQKETFQSIIKDTFSTDEKKAEKIFMEVQENLNNMLDEYNAIYDDTDAEPISLTKDDIQSLLIESGVPEELTTKIEKSYVDTFGDELPLVENLIDAKTLKANEQIKREKHLEKQVEILQTRLEQVKQESAVDNETPLSTENNEASLVNNIDNLEVNNDTTDLDKESINNNISLEENSDTDSKEDLESNIKNVDDTDLDDNDTTLNYDVILQVRPEKIPQIKSQIIDGQKCIVIPINEDEQTTVNGLDDLI